jgi:hypothetical protein
MNILPTDHNLTLAAAMIAEMEPYLLSTEIFWPIDSRKPRDGLSFPRLTLGGLQLTMDQLQAVQREMTPAQASDHRRLVMFVDQLRFKHAVALESKAVREAGSRLNLWRAFVLDLEETPRRAGNYEYEVRHRVMLARLEEFAGDHIDFREKRAAAEAVDRRLRAMFVDDAFRWDARLETIYPREVYWYLYGHPREDV